MHSRNNLCNSLIVYGDWAPGGSKHNLISHLLGEWKKGKMLVGYESKGNDIYPGESETAEAWIIKFSDCNAKLFTEECEKQKYLLFDRWNELDLKMQPKMYRDSKSWWPENKKTERGSDDQKVVNIYLPIKNYPDLSDFYDSVNPDDQCNDKKLWKQSISGEKKYEECEFFALIKDSTLKECQEIFKDLPKGNKFIEKLSFFYKDMGYETDYLLKETDEGTHLYVSPKNEQVLTDNEALDLVKNDMKNKTKYISKSDLEVIKNIKFVVSRPSEGLEEEDDKAYEIIEFVNDDISCELIFEEHYLKCLSEACYGIASSYIICNFLMSDFSKSKYDFSIPYKLWKGGWEYEIYGNICYIFKQE